MKLSVETKHVLSDLKTLQAFDINAYGRAAALIRELYDNQDTAAGRNLIDQLNIQNHDLDLGPRMVGNSLRIQHEKFIRNLWRLKLWRVATDGTERLEPYRIIYGFYAATQFRRAPEIRLFAVPCRAHEKDDSYDYKPDHPIHVRVRADYDAYE